MLFSTFGMVLVDEAGTKEIWGLRGSSSWRPCALCANVVNARFGFEEHATRDIVLHTDTDIRKLRLHTDESVFAIIDKLQEASANLARCKELEKIHGFNHQPHGVLQCLQLRSVMKPATCISYDFMHCFLTNGVADYELQLYWRECLSQKLLTLKAMEDWMECFTWPMRHKKPTTMWSAYHTGEEEYYGGGASNILSFYPAFRDLITRVIPAHELAPQTSSLLALFRILDGWSVYQRTSRTPPRWQEHIHTWMQLAKVAWPDSTWKPKHHYCIHQPQIIEHFGILPSTFATERRHKLYKQVSARVHQSNDKFEFSVMVSLVASHFQTLLAEEDPCNPEKLIGGQEALESFRRVVQLPVEEVSQSAKAGGITIKSGDMVWISMGADRYSVAEIVLLMKIEGAAHIHCMVTPYKQVGQAWVRQRMMHRVLSCLVVDAAILGRMHWRTQGPPATLSAIFCALDKPASFANKQKLGGSIMQLQPNK